MVSNGGTINFSRKCHNTKITMGEYVLNSLMLSIPMGGANVVLGVQWLQSLGMVDFNFQEFFLNFFSEGKEIKLRDITGKPGKIISSNVMTKLPKKEKRNCTIMLTRSSNMKIIYFSRSPRSLGKSFQCV